MAERLRTVCSRASKPRGRKPDAPAAPAGVILPLPILALGNYALLAFGMGFVVFRWMKTAENSSDYSLMNNAKAMLWLPTSREEKGGCGSSVSVAPRIRAVGGTGVC